MLILRQRGKTYHVEWNRGGDRRERATLATRSR